MSSILQLLNPSNQYHGTLANSLDWHCMVHHTKRDTPCTLARAQPIYLRFKNQQQEWKQMFSEIEENILKFEIL